MKTSLQLASILSMIGLSATCGAEDFSHHVGVRAGLWNQELSALGNKSDGQDVAWGFEYVALKTINDSGSVKLGLHTTADISSVSHAGGTADNRIFTIAPEVALNLMNNFDAYAKAGLGFWNTKYKVDGLSDTDSGNDFIYGIGLRYALKTGAYSSIEYTHFKTDSLGLTQDNNQVLLSLGYRF
ncbi:porin family protein [Vibrio cionasavignyae]|uniref:porin family protein n=1 Tax=Vibrio cionasavignyae TaxID=2910252 RepID=UPI003D0BBD24